MHNALIRSSLNNKLMMGDKMDKYHKRIMDKVLEDDLKAFGTILINGPKWCGKTTTAKQFVKSIMDVMKKQHSRLIKFSVKDR